MVVTAVVMVQPVSEAGVKARMVTVMAVMAVMAVVTVMAIMTTASQGNAARAKQHDCRCGDNCC